MMRDEYGEILPDTPAADGYRMPAEFEPHEQCLMLWPERADNWRERAVPAQAAYAAVAAAIRRFESVSVGVSPGELPQAEPQLAASGASVLALAHDDSWMRDVGPTFVAREGRPLRGVHWRFNAWGGLYSPCDLDQAVAARVLEGQARGRYRAPLVLEGGAIHVDGEGTALATEECVLNTNRNPEMTRERLEVVLRDYLGVSHVIWLGRGVFADETGGHIDNLACFVAPGKVVLHWTDDRSDPQHPISLEAWERLNDARDALGRRLEVTRLPMPGPLFMTEEEARGLEPSAVIKPRHAGDRLSASYVNFYFANGGIVMPLLDRRTDAAAAQCLQRLCPQRQVIGVPAREILLGGGGIHCITQQVPATR
jgi:agmatine deiminase